MEKKRICFIAQFPPPIHGLSKAVDTLYNSKISEKYELQKINITDNREFISNMIKICKSRADLYYFTISQTRGGNLRDLFILRLLRKQGKKCLIHLHGGYYRQLVDNDLPRWQKRVNYREINKVEGAIVLGESLKEIFKDMLPDERIYIVPNCVDDEYLMSEEEFEDKMQGFPERKIKHILYLSNLIKSKGYIEVLKMAKMEQERVKCGGEIKFHYDFAGKFFEREEEVFFWNYVKDNHIEEYITYHGVVSGDNKRNLLKKADIFVLLSRYPKEGQPISILEAFGNGVMVVTTNHAGIPEQVQSGFNGIVVNKEHIDVSRIYNNLLKLSNVNMQRNGRAIVKEKFCQLSYITNMDNCFSRVMNLD